MDASPAPDNPYDICYWVDMGDVIVHVAPGWETFAQSNEAPDLITSKVVGRNLLSFVQGDATRMYVRTLIQSARLLRKPLVRAYRCDSPDTRRFMEMRLTVENSGLLRWEHRLLRTEPFARAYAFQAAAPRSLANTVIRCSMCNNVKSNGQWVDPAEATETNATAPDTALSVIYGVCPSCQAFPARPAPRP